MLNTKDVVEARRGLAKREGAKQVVLGVVDAEKGNVKSRILHHHPTQRVGSCLWRFPPLEGVSHRLHSTVRAWGKASILGGVTSTGAESMNLIDLPGED